VIFDMDGLMLDTERPVLDLWVQAAEKFGRKMSQEVILRTIGITEDSTRAILLEEYGDDFPYGEIREELVRLVREYTRREGLAHRPGLLVLLDRLRALGTPLGVATSTSRRSAVWKLEQAGIRDRFGVLVCGDEVPRGKPAPDIFLRAAELLETAPENCLGFEDSAAGLKALAAAKIRSVFVTDILEPPPEILAGVWRRYGDLAEAAELFPLS
jgi:HAD superfamily hydrolase (TIGR01509 family)